jgi:DNA mismatch repair protein MutS
MALVKEYFDLTKKYQSDYGEKTVLLMQVGSFFEVYGYLDKKTNTIGGSNIEEFSQICELNVVAKNVCVGEVGILMAGFKDIMIDKYLKKIQDAGFTAVVYTQDQAAKNTTRSCAGIFSPGTYFSNDSTKLTNNITCVWIETFDNRVLMKGKYVVAGIANIDIYTGKTSIFQFKEPYLNSPTTYDELERFISVYNPSETIIISNLSEKEVNDVISFANIKSNLIHKIYINRDTNTNNNLYSFAKKCEKQNYQKEILLKFYEIHDYDSFLLYFYDNNIATQAFCFLLDFVHQHNPQLVRRVSPPIFENCSDRLILANHSLQQLNIIDDNMYNGKYSSVLKLLNICYTPMGKRKFAHLFLNPSTNKKNIEREYDITEYLLNHFEVCGDTFKHHLSSIKDLSKWERQVFLKKISPKSFYNLYNNIQTIQEIYLTMVKKDVQIKEYMNQLNIDIDNIGEYCDNILKCINEHLILTVAQEIDQTQQFEQNFIQPGVDTQLDDKLHLLAESDGKLEAIRSYLNAIIPDKGKTADFIKIHETEKNNFTLLCTNRRCKLLEDSLPLNKQTVTLTYNNDKQFHYIVSRKHFEYKTQTSTNNSIVDEEIKFICKNINNTKVSLKDTITLVFNKFVTHFETYQTQLQSIIHFITTMDVIFARAIIAKKYNYCKPKIAEAEKSFVDAKNLRHCLIEHLQTNELYISNDIQLGNSETDGILLYGTNAVGKTSFIRAIGIAIIMAQSGLYVPCSEFVYKPYNYIFTRILGNDNIFKGLSTFAVEMSELRTILRLADKNSLILGDELCSGTENTSAISIFVAGIQKLHQCKSSFIFATHLHEIIKYSEISDLKSVVLKHMEVFFDKERDILVYDRKLKDGPGNSMYGLEVCKSLSLPEDFLAMAYNIRLKYNPETRGVLSLDTSHFNSKKIKGMCEKCGKNMGTEVHHLQHQQLANDNQYINNSKSSMTFSTNHVANLLNVCEDCHQDFHKQYPNGHKKVKTSNGYELQAL